MTFPITEVVTSSVTLQDAQVTETVFNIPLILGANGSFDGGARTQTYSSIDAVLEDFASSDDEYLAAAAIFAQDPKVNQIVIGVEDTRVAQVQTITFSADIVTSNSITVTVDGTLVTQAFSSDNDTTLAALATQIQALSGVATAVASGSPNRVITITAAKAGVPVSITLGSVTGGASQATMTLATTVDNHGPAEDVAEIREENDAWYGLVWTERDSDLVEQMAAYIQATRKIFVSSSSDANIYSAVSTTDIAAVFQAESYTRTMVSYNGDTDEYGDAAVFGKMFTYEPGEATIAYKTLSSVTPDSLTTTQRNAIFDKNANTYERGQGVNVYRKGTMASGLFMDNRISIDWLQAQIEEKVYELLVTSPKVPYTDAGIAMVENVLRRVLQNALAKGVIADDPAFTVTVPVASAVSSSDRSTRTLRNIVWTARLAGAIQTVDIQGTLSV